ncbi:indolethylamine N-methyltransferase-like [Ixodes scapularis]|uniref:indolethylamine N-methyltransferase-like n=1 Tax=Ixodes scapularis TaxID=6945 RepID=UPI001C38CA01|nr:indolethylamine N-methyltransferase-like [Ixodes scapularis]
MLLSVNCTVLSSTPHSLESMSSQALRDAYKEQFRARTYVDSYFTGEISFFQLEETHRLFQSDLIQGETLLEVGSGPMIVNSLMISSRFKHIVLSDLVEENKLELNKWINRDADAIDWSLSAEQIAAIEGYGDIKKGAMEILERTRAAIRKVVSCDVVEPAVLPVEHKETFDVVLSCGCLESAAAEHESYRRVVCNVATVVKPGGLLVILGVGGLKQYSVGTADFTLANITGNVVTEAVTDAGLQIDLYRPRKIGCFSGSSDVFTFYLVARKA